MWTVFKRSLICSLAMTVVSGYIKSMCVCVCAAQRGRCQERECTHFMQLLLNHFVFYQFCIGLLATASSVWMELGKRSLSRAVIYLWKPSSMLVCATLCVILADEVESVTRIVVPYILLLLCSSKGIKSHYLSQPHLFSNSWRTDVPTGLDWTLS